VEVSELVARLVGESKLAPLEGALRATSAAAAQRICGFQVYDVWDKRFCRSDGKSKAIL